MLCLSGRSNVHDDHASESLNQESYWEGYNKVVSTMLTLVLPCAGISEENSRKMRTDYALLVVKSQGKEDAAKEQDTSMDDLLACLGEEEAKVRRL